MFSATEHRLVGDCVGFDSQHVGEGPKEVGSSRRTVPFTGLDASLGVSRIKSCLFLFFLVLP